MPSPDPSGRVLVVGGGITGLVAARALAREGVPVTLAEAGSRLGGKIRTERDDGFLVEHGPDSFIAARPAAISLARELGLGDELIGVRDPRVVYIRLDGTLVPMPAGLGLVLPTRVLPFVRSRLFSWPEKLRMAWDVIAPRRLGSGDVAVGSLLRARLGDALVDRLAGPLVGGVYGTPIDESSLDAVVPQLRTAEREHRSLLLAGLAEGRRARASMATRPTTSKPLGLFVSLRGGMSRLVEALATSAEAAGAELRTDLPVRRLERAGSRAGVHFADGSSAHFEAVVVATPAPTAAVLLNEALPDAARALEAIAHGTSILVTLAYPSAAIERELTGHGELVPHSEGGAISACTWTSEKWPERAPAGAALFRVFVRDEDEWTRLPDEALVAAARADTERTLRITAEPVLVRVSRYERSMPRYTVGHLERVEAIDTALSRWPAIVTTGASYRGIGLPDCVSQGQAAAAAVLERMDRARDGRPAAEGSSTVPAPAGAEGDQG